MKIKRLISLVLCGAVILCCFTGCSANVNEIALESKYSVDSVSDYKISTTSGLGLKLLKYTEGGVEKQVYLLAYLNDENIEVNTENTYVKSLAVGQTCISMTTTMMDLGRNLNMGILKDLINQLNTRLNEDKAEKIIEHIDEGDNRFYIISKNDTYVFIDYLTTIPNINNKVAYYRIILQDVSLLDKELTQEDIDILPNHLPELLEVLGVTEDFELPK